MKFTVKIDEKNLRDAISTIDHNEQLSKKDVESWLRDAIQSSGGQYITENWQWHITRNATVKCKKD